ncbi:hypothetical protein [Pseudomonas sp. R5(2019)]|uniref:hypothetical protein n=1 Tax=Pseudomonas sp. R5(2019) TaxID=2697566 RepID=UPI0014127394|nr:hypothetical protein [Pseudomonas sp. R5(2019)]NBA95330.1 hypothetical protein [Pseudomonas sp. R5(2019)]
MSGATMFVGGKPVYVYSYNPNAGLRAVFQYRNILPKSSVEAESMPYLNACSFFDSYQQSRTVRALARMFSPIANLWVNRKRKHLESNLSGLAASSFDWTKIQMLNVSNAVHLVFIDYLSKDGAHLVYPSVHLYERVLSPVDLDKICTEQFSRMSGELAVAYKVAA